MDIQCFRLMSGEDVIAGVTEDLQGMALVLNKPMAIIMMPNQQGNYTLGLAPYVPFRKSEDLTISMSAVLFDFEPADQLVTEYRRLTSPIQQVDASALASLEKEVITGKESAPKETRPKLHLL